MREIDVRTESSSFLDHIPCRIPQRSTVRRQRCGVRPKKHIHQLALPSRLHWTLVFHLGVVVGALSMGRHGVYRAGWLSPVSLTLLLMLSCVAVLLLAEITHAEPVPPTRVSPMPVRDDWHNDAGMRRADLEEQYNTSSSALPTGVSAISGQPPATSTSTPHDPLLAIMPDFAFSMPAQVVVDGVNLALTTMLTIQLIFTMQYHFPLSKKNYVLQSCSTLILLISLAVHLHTVLNTLEHQVHGWPYMFAYIAVQIPPQDGSWTLVQETFYLLMRALSTLFIHLTHIQFLTLLFPSALEARLILWMLGPLALAASGMEFTALSSDDDVKTSDLGDAIRNICNSTLFLLYTSGLLIWGLLVNRRRAWRTDGGTAAFGGGSVGLAFLNTTVSFVEIAFDRLWWLPDILWTLTLWQSWLGFWWWVGSGMGIGEVEDRAERQERRRKREAKLRRKREREEKARQKAATKTNVGSGTGSQMAAAASSLGETGSDAILGGIRRIRSKFTGEDRGAAPSTLNRRARTAGTQTGDEEIELDRVEAEHSEEPLQSIAIDDGQQPDDVQTVAGSGSQSSDTHPTTSAGATSNAGWLGSVADFIATHQPNFIRRRMRRLRLAHVAAARRAATEQSMLRDQVLNRQSEPMGPGLRTMMFDVRSSAQTPASPSMGGGGWNGGGGGARVGFQPSLTTDSTGTSSGRHAVLPILLEGDAPHRISPSQSGQNSIRSLSVLPDSTDRRIGDEWRRHSMHATARSPASGATGLSLSNEVRNAPTPTGAPDGDEWVDDETGHEAVDAERSSNDDSSSNVAHDGDAGMDTGSGRDAQGRSTTSWAWRGGLRSLRMRDHTTYD